MTSFEWSTEKINDSLCSLMILMFYSLSQLRKFRLINSAISKLNTKRGQSRGLGLGLAIEVVFAGLDIVYHKLSGHVWIILNKSEAEVYAANRSIETSFSGVSKLLYWGGKGFLCNLTMWFTHVYKPCGGWSVLLDLCSSPHDSNGSVFLQ